jgi:hypothetical protein
MRSPFAIFRKHQKTAMVVLTGLSMFAFVVMDSIKQDSPMAMPILGAAIGMLLFGYYGFRRGEPVTWGIAGTALGIAIGVIGMRFGASGPKPAVQTAMGDISTEEMKNLVNRRTNANNFLRYAFEKVDPPKSNNPMFLNYYGQKLQSLMFNFGLANGDDTADDVIMGYLLDKEADDMGITVSDAAVSDYISKVTERKLSQAQYLDVLKQLHLTEGQLYDAIRAELRARLAMEMLIPRATPTPEQYWDDYRKLQVTQTLDIAAVPVTDFLAEAPQPTDEEIRQYYDAWKNIVSPAPGMPGMFQPRRVRIEFLEADYAEIEKQVAAKPITDAEVKKYYDEHRQEYRTRPAAGSSTLSPLMQDPNVLTDPGLTVPEAPSLPAPIVPKGPPAQQPAAPNMPGGSPSSSVPKAPATPANATPPKSTPAPKKTDASKSGTSNDRPARNLGLDGEMLALADGPFDRSLQVAYQSAPTTGSGATKPQPNNADKAAAKPSAASPAAAAQAPREPNPPALPKKAGAAQTGAAAKSTPEPEFRPLDDLMQREIRDLITRNRTLEIMTAKTQAAYEYMKKLREQLTPAEVGGESPMSAQQRAKALTEYAAKSGLKYGITPLLSAMELQEASEQYPIAAAAEPLDNPFQNKEPISVIQEVFTSPVESLFQPAQADDRDSHRFAFWKAEDVERHSPSLDEPGVREAAIRGWKIEKYARKQAETRAQELADLVRKSKKPMTEALAGQTVTKKPKATAVLTVPVPPFSWYTVSSTAPQGLMPDPTPKLSEVVGVKLADDAFMKAVFDEMKVGDVKVVPNLGASAYYVVRVKTRHPENAEEMAAFRARFMKENFFGSFLGHSTYEYLNAPPEQKLLTEFTQRLFAKYGVKPNVEEEAPRSTRSRRRNG